MYEAHWGSRAWRKNLDETIMDPEHPQAFPAGRAADMMGRIRVRIRAEDGNLVAYGYGGQRIAIPATEIGAVRTAAAYRTGGGNRSQALLVFDKDGRILLRAAGLWETYGEVARVCRAIKAPKPTYVTSTYTTVPRGKTRGGQQRTRRVKQVPLFQKAAGYRRLRTMPRSAALRVLAVIVLFAVTVGIAGFIGTVPALLLPGWIGKVRVLIGMVGCALGVAGGIWLFAAITHAVVDSLRWAVASLRAMGLAPPDRFFRRRGSSQKWSGFVTAGMVILVPLLFGWGPVLALVSGVHGVTDSELVAHLRATGVQTQGVLIDVPDYSTDSNGNTTVTDVATLSFGVGGQSWQDTDPSIGGRPLPLDAGDPADTHVPLTVVYDPNDPNTAAALQQMTGSVWHGAPTANVITGIIFTLALPFLVWRVVVRVRRRRWVRNADLLDDIATAEG